MRIIKISILTIFCAAAWLSISGSEAFGQEVNLALNKSVKQSTTFECCPPSITPGSPGYNSGKPELAVDGITDKIAGGIAETINGDTNAWFEIDLGAYYKINKIVIHARDDDYGNGCCLNQFHSVWVIVTDHPLEAKPMVDEAKIAYSSTYAQFFKNPINGREEIPIGGKIGRYVRLQTKSSRIELKEVEVLGINKQEDHTPNPAKAWNAVLQIPFDPNFPNFLALKLPDVRFHHFNTLPTPPRVIGVKNPNGSFDLAFQLLGKNTIRINNYVKDGTGFKKTTNSKSFEGLGLFGGFAKDAAGNRYVFTGAFSELIKYDNGDTDWTRATAKVYKNEAEFWNAQFAEGGKVDNVKAMMHYGESRLVVGKDSTGKESLLIASNFAPAHPYQVVLDLQTQANNDGRAFYESRGQHNFGQRAIFDGSDFVVMENRDHDVSVTLSKIKPGEKFPLKYSDKTDADVANMSNADKENMHANMYKQRIFSVYSHTNFANHTFTELGNVEKGMNDNGYLVLFASERDWSDKMKDFTDTGKVIKTWDQPQILTPRDIGLVHVKKDFEKERVNWMDNDGKLTSCPALVDNSKLVNSTGDSQIVKYKTANDGWDWARYSPGSGCENKTERQLTTKGVMWVTQHGAGSTTKATGDFNSVNHPKLVRIAANKYIVLWEEWKADSAGLGNPKKEYLTTKAALITLKPAANNEVNIELTLAPKDLGKVRLIPGDEAFEFEGKAAWAVGDVTKGKLMFYTVDANLNLVSHELEL